MTNNNSSDTRYVNRKPYRTKAQKAEARATAVKCADGTWRSNAPVTYHKGKGS